MSAPKLVLTGVCSLTVGLGVQFYEALDASHYVTWPLCDQFHS